MIASLKAFGFIAVFMYLMMAVFMPFVDPLWFLLSIPLIPALPHMDRIMNYLSDWMK